MSDKSILTENEKRRFEVISLCLQRKITNKQAAAGLQRSIRQIRRVGDANYSELLISEILARSTNLMEAYCV